MKAAEKGKKKSERSGEGWLRWGNLKPQKSWRQQAVVYDKYPMHPGEIFLSIVKGVGICGVLSYTFYRSLKVFLCILPLAFLMIPREKHRLKEKQKQQLTREFRESMVVLSSALSAGYSMENALDISRRELVMLYGEKSLIGREFTHMVQQIHVNRTVEQVLEDFARRSGLEDVQNFSQVFMVAKRSGGDLSQIMRNTASAIGDKLQVKEEIRTMTASRRFEQNIMNLIPFFIVFYVEGSSPGFFGQMYGTLLGRILMSGCLVVYLISYFLSQKILDIQV